MRISASGVTPAEVAWERYTSYAAWPTWAPQIRGVGGAMGSLQVGDRGVVHGPLVVRLPFEILAVDHELWRWRWRVGFGPASVTLDHGIDALDVGTQAWADIHAPTILVAPYTPLAKLALQRLVNS